MTCNFDWNGNFKGNWVKKNNKSRCKLKISKEQDEEQCTEKMWGKRNAEIRAVYRTSWNITKMNWYSDMAGKDRGRRNYKMFTLYCLHRADYTNKYNCNMELQHFQDAPTIKA